MKSAKMKDALADAILRENIFNQFSQDYCSR